MTPTKCPILRAVALAAVFAASLSASPLRADEAASLRGFRVAPSDGGAAALTLRRDDGKAADGARPIPASIATLLAAEVAGFDKSTVATVPLGTWACLSPPGAAVQNALAPLIAWRQRQGYHVVAATTDQIGGNTGNNIKSWLQDLYDNLDVPLEMVCLVGDATGAVVVDSWRESVSGLNGEGDHFYTQLDGGDILGDVHLGRLSVTSVSELTTVVNKIVAYESDPWLADDPMWFTRAGLVADVSESGWSTIFSSQWVKQHLLRLNYTSIDTIFGGNYVALQMASLNAGKSLYTYRGHWRMSGLTTGHIALLSNGGKLPFVVTLTCDTGSFWTDTTCQSEAFLRAPNGGGIAAIGTATTGTHTRYNDCMFQGIIDHVLLTGDPRLGPALSRGKLHMYANYWTAEPDPVRIWSVWNNLMGDPATPLWTAVPRQLAVTAPGTLGTNANALPVKVLAGGAPVEGAVVAVRGSGDPLAVGVTGADGRVVLSLPALGEGTLQLTVTGRNLRPWLGSVIVDSQVPSLRPLAPVVDDDNLGYSRGDGDGVAEPGETIELTIPLLNAGPQDVKYVTVAMRPGPAPGVTVLRPLVQYLDIGPGLAGAGTAPFLVALAPSAAGGASVPLTLDFSTGTGALVGVVALPVSGPAMSIAAVAAGDAAPGAQPSLGLSLTNVGDQATAGASASLRSRDRWVTVTQADSQLPGAAVGGGTTTAAGAFALDVAPDCPAGHLATLDLYLAFAEGGTGLLEVPVVCGQAAASDPCGPDARGYYAFDDLDTGYPQAPVYEWVEIDPALGGPGVSLGLTDYALYGDQTKTIDLPFTFRYYGQDFTRMSVCSNGWLSFGATPVVYYRNWKTPTPGAADNMVCAFWDDLLLDAAEGGVFTWYDAAQHRLVIEWSRLRNEVDGVSVETFEAILFDPAFTAGETGDGDILLQYHTVNQVDDVNGYATVGIQNATRDDGVLYSYWNLPAPGGAPLQPGRAVRFTTLLNRPDGMAAAPVPAAAFTLAQNRPNPFNPRTRIAFTLAEPGTVSLAVFDASGRQVRRLTDGLFAAGAHEAVWQGDDEQGGAVASGTYFYRLRTAAGEQTRKMTLLR